MLQSAPVLCLGKTARDLALAVSAPPRFLEIALHDASQTVDEEYLTLGSYDSELALLRSQVAQRVASFLSDSVRLFAAQYFPGDP